MPDPTPHLGLPKPEVNDEAWDDDYYSAMDRIDAHPGVKVVESDDDIPADPWPGQVISHVPSSELRKYIEGLGWEVVGLSQADSASLAFLTGIDYSTEATLDLVRLLLVSIDGRLNNLNGVDYATQTTLALVADRLADILDATGTVTGTVALDGPTLAALESVTAVVSGTVALDPATLAALESVTATVSGTVELGATSLAALENVVVSGTVELGPASLAALETTTVTVTGTVPVSGALTDDELRAEALEVTGPLTDTQLRASTLGVTGPLTDDELRAAPVEVTTGGLTDAEMRAAPVPVATTDTRGLVERMMGKAPVDGYALWVDVTSSNPNYIYVAEAPVGSTSVSNTFRGVRITLDTTGSPLGAIQTSDGFVWDNRAIAPWVS